MINLSIGKEQKKKLARMTVGRYYDSSVKKNQKKKMINRYNQIDSWCRQYIQIGGVALSLIDVICADYLQLCEIKEEFKKYKREWEKIVWGNTTADDFMIDTLYKRNFPRKEFINDLNVNVCPYCNRNFINATSNVSTCQLDHFFSKKEYSLLAVSFENLVPVCPACNHKKREKSINHSPYDNRYNIDSLMQFSFVINNVNYISDKRGISILIQSKDNLIQKNLDVLGLEKLYQIHTDVVCECIKKGMMYSKEYINDMVNTYSDVFESKEEVYQLIFGNYLNSEDYCNRPLAKMTKDIVKEIFEILYAEDIDNVFYE